jgi:hypothetical protein
MTAEARLADLLRSRGAETIEHPGGTLYAHLERVQNRLARLGASIPLQLAARAHAVYGTDGFEVSLLQLDERSELVEIIGVDAELLVYQYGACDRRRTWKSLADDGRVWDRFTGTSHELTPTQVRAFADLSLVNELDVAEHSPTFLEQYGDYFRRLATSWEGLLTPAVAAEAARVLGSSS